MNELKITSAADYKKKYVKTKIVKAPSGAVFKIRGISPLDFWAAPQLAEAAAGNQDLSASNNLEALKLFLTRCVVEPKISDKSTNECKDELSLEEINMEDSMFLSTEISDLSSGGSLDFLTKGQDASHSTTLPADTKPSPAK